MYKNYMTGRIYFAPPDDDGSAMSFEQLKKASADFAADIPLPGSSPDPAPPSAGGDEPAKPQTQAEPPAEPPAAPADPPQDGGDPAPAPAPDKPDEVFYHPEIHAKGEGVHPNTYKTRTDAETGLIAKSVRLAEKIAEMKAAGIDPSTANIPEVLGYDLSGLGKFSEDENVIGLDDDTLRKNIVAFDKYYKANFDKMKAHSEKSEKVAKVAETDKLISDGQKLVEQLGLEQTAKSAESIDDFFAEFDKVAKAKVADAAKDAQAALEAFENDEDAYDSMTPKEYAGKLKKLLSEVEGSKAKAQKEFSEKRELLQKALDAVKSPDEKRVEKSPEQLKAGMKEAFAVFQADNKDSLGIFKTESPDPLTRFFKYATANSAKFNQLQSPLDWVKAYHDKTDGYQAYLAGLEAKRGQKTPATPPSQDPGIPAPGDQTHLRDGLDGKYEDAQARELARLKQMTRQAVSA